jgi:hypothetical protein
MSTNVAPLVVMDVHGGPIMQEDAFEGGDAQAGWADAFHRPESTDSYLPWLAVGAVVVGAVGAVVGLSQCGTKRARLPWPETGPERVTPPHGDKLPYT